MSLRRFMSDMNNNILKCLIDCIKCSFGIGDYKDIVCDDLVLLAKIAMLHSVDYVIYPVLQKKYPDDKNIMPVLSKRYKSAIMIDATQQYYTEQIEKSFEDNGIRYCVMKGPVIKNLYPSSEMRKSNDIDIFVDNENTEKAKDLMVGLGFKVKSFNKAVAHDEYCIGKMIEVEIHRTLVSNKCPWDKECQKIIDRLILSDGHKYKYEMTKEDYYLYMISHMAKHMKYSGIGIKMVLDVWVYLNAYQNVLDFNEINLHLKKCGLFEFENNIRALCSYWFDGKEASEKIIKLGIYIAASGNFGTYEQLVAGNMAQNAVGTSSKTISKFTLLIKSFFLPYKKMEQRYPKLKKYPVLLPIYWVLRAFNAAFIEKDRGKKILNKYDNIDLEYGKKIIEFKKEIGL